MKVLSLFDWMSCWRIALERAWIKVDKYYASEIDKYAIQISQKNYPGIIHIWDVIDVKWEDYDVDLLIWGSPCQSFSIAGKQEGFKWKSGLFYEYVRILKETKPEYFLLENVKMKKEFQDIISKELWVEPIEINSSLLSAQNRKRLYRTNIPWITQPKDKWILLKDILEDDFNDKENFIWNLYNKRIMIEKSGTLWASMWRTSKQWMCVFDKCIIQRPRGFNKWWEYFEKSPTLSSNSWQENNKLFDGSSIRKLTPLECERLQTLPDNYSEGVSNTQRYKMIGNWRTVDVIAHILSFI